MCIKIRVQWTDTECIKIVVNLDIWCGPNNNILSK